jgi:hypothetical protein
VVTAAKGLLCFLEYRLNKSNRLRRKTTVVPSALGTQMEIENELVEYSA